MERVVIGLALVDDEMEVGDGCTAAETYISVNEICSLNAYGSPVDVSNSLFSSKSYLLKGRLKPM